MADTKKTRSSVVKRNVIESLKDLGGDFGSQGTDLLKSTSEDFFKELMGVARPAVKRSGEITPGQSLQMNEVISGKEEENKLLRAQISLERNLSNDEKRLSQEKMQELRVQLQAITVEISKLAASTGNLATQTEIAMVEVPVNPGVYHVVFFEKVLEFLQSFRKKIDLAATWLGSSNKRAEKKNYWSMYKKKGSSFLLSPDHYLQRSAG
jgi:hypothetical protein